MVVALNDVSNPKLRDPDWVARTSDLGQCVTISPQSIWEPLTADRGGLTYIAYRGNIGRPGSFWVPTLAIVFPIHETPPVAVEPAPAMPMLRDAEPPTDTRTTVPSVPLFPQTPTEPAPSETLPPETVAPVHPMKDTSSSPIANEARPTAQVSGDDGELSLMGRASLTLVALLCFWAWLYGRRSRKR